MVYYPLQQYASDRAILQSFRLFPAVGLQGDLPDSPRFDKNKRILDTAQRSRIEPNPLDEQKPVLGAEPEQVHQRSVPVQYR